MPVFMRFRNIFSRHYSKAHKAGRVHIYNRPYIIPIMGLFVGVLIVLGILIIRGGSPPRPYDSHIVFVFDNGQKQTIDTRVATVGDLVKRLPLHLIPEDVIEPSLDTKIVQDNFRINVYRARPVTVVDNGVKTVAITAQKSPRVAAQDAGITVYPEDNTSFVQGDISENTIGEQVVIDRATPVALTLYGTPLTVRTHTKTVGDLLKEKQVKLTKDDVLAPAADTPITPDIAVAVVRNGTQVTTVEEPIAPPVQYVDDASLSLGATAVRQPGAAGKKVVTYQVITQNAIVTSKTVLQSVVTQNPVPQIVARGTTVYVIGDHAALMATAGISPGDYGYVDYIVGNESGWCPTKAQGEHYCSTVPDNPYTPYGYGFCQATPGSKMVSAGADWATNPITQLRWCSGYATTRYGGWAGAYNHWVAYHNW